MCMNVYSHTAYPRCPQRPEKSPGSPGTLVTDHVGAGKEPGSSTRATVAAGLLSCFSSLTDIQIPENSSQVRKVKPCGDGGVHL